ncbi:MAG TPA: lipopolysaccharide biosynthesis protein [Thermoleophilaceae bacterium]
MSAVDTREAPRVGRDIAITTATQVTVAVGGLLLYRLLALEKGAEGVASYALVKQISIFAWPVVMVGLQTGIPRYVALGRSRPGGAEATLVAALLVTTTTMLAVSALALVSPGTTASVVFGDSGRTHLVMPLVLTLVATVVLEVVYGYFRGQADFVVGNAVRVVGVATLPVVLLLVAADRSIGTLIALMAAGLLAGSALAVALPLARALRATSAAEVRAAGRELLDYGHRRVVGEVAAVVLFTIPPILAAHYAPLDEVAWLATGLYVIAVLSIAFQPVGVVFLPLLSRLVESDFEAARRYTGHLAAAGLHIAVFVTPQLLLFADDAVRAWLGSEFDGAGRVIRIVVLSAGVYVITIVVRSALDAAAVTAYNARNNMISLAVAAVAAVVSLGADLGDPLECIAWSFTLGVACMGVLTLVVVVRVFDLPRSSLALRAALALGGLAAAAAVGADLAVIGDGASAADLAVIAALECLLAAGFVAGLVRAGAQWPRVLWARRPGRGAAG